MSINAISDELNEIGRAHDGIVLTRELRGLGWDEAAIRQAVSTMHRLVRGAYATTRPTEAAARHEQLARAVMLVHPQLVLSHLSAASIWGLPLLGSPPLHIQTTRIGPRVHGWRDPSGIKVHGQPVDPKLVTHRRGIRVTSPSRTVVDCSRILRHEEAVVLADAATHQGLATLDQMRQHVYGMVGWKGVGHARRMLKAVDPLAESPQETKTRLMMLRLGYECESQVDVWFEGHFVARVDLILKGRWVVIEYDGRGKYHHDDAPEEVFQQEKRRHDALVMAGYEVVRLTAEDLDDPVRVRGLVDAAVARAERRHPQADDA